MCLPHTDGSCQSWSESTFLRLLPHQCALYHHAVDHLFYLPHKILLKWQWINIKGKSSGNFSDTFLYKQFYWQIINSRRTYSQQQTPEKLQQKEMLNWVWRNTRLVVTGRKYRIEMHKNNQNNSLQYCSPALSISPTIPAATITNVYNNWQWKLEWN